MRANESPGIYRKYLVKRLRDKEGKHDRCEYFVLDWMHDPFAVTAARAYANACETELPALASELRAKASDAEARWNTKAARGGNDE